MTPSTRLKTARQSLGLTLTEMAERLGLAGAQAKDDLRKMESGARPVTGPVLVAAEGLLLVRDLSDHIEGVTGAMPGSDSAELVERARALVH